MYHHCPICQCEVPLEEVVLAPHGDEVHAVCGAVLAARSAGLDASVHETTVLSSGFVSWENSTAHPGLDTLGVSRGRVVRRTPPIRARPGPAAKRSVPVSVPSSMGYHRIYHFHERISQRQNIEVSTRPFAVAHSRSRAFHLLLCVASCGRWNAASREQRARDLIDLNTPA